MSQMQTELVWEGKIEPPFDGDADFSMSVAIVIRMRAQHEF
jgi:hypothetical protein